MRILDNTPIGVKSLISPLFSCIMAALIGLVLYVSTNDITKAVRMNMESNAFSDSMQDAILYLSDAHTNLYKTLNWTQTSVDQKLIDEAIAGTKNALAKTKDIIKSIDANKVNASEETIQSLHAGIKAYEEGMLQVIDLVAVDMAMANIFLNDCQSRFTPLRASLDVLAEEAHKQAAIVTEHLQSTVKTSLRVGLFCVGMMIVFGLLIGGTIGRAIAGPIKSITNVMNELTNGNKNVDIPDHDRRDEVGAMARAVLIFKENMIKSEALEQQQAEERKGREQRAILIERHVGDFQKTSAAVVSAVTQSASQLQENARAHINGERDDGQSLNRRACSG